MFRYNILAGAIAEECVGCGAERIQVADRKEIETLSEKIFLESFLRLLAVFTSKQKSGPIYVRLDSGEIIDSSTISEGEKEVIEKIAQYAHDMVQRKNLLKDSQNRYAKSSRFRSLSFSEHKFIFYAYTRLCEKAIKGELIPENVRQVFRVLRRVLAPYEDGPYCLTPANKGYDAALPEDVEEFFEEISRTFSQEVMRDSELRLMEQYSLHCMLPLVARTISTCSKIFFVISSQQYRDYALKNCKDCEFMKALQSEFILKENSIEKIKWKNGEGKKSLEKPQCSKYFSSMLCFPKLMMRYRHEISILRRKLRKMENRYSFTQLSSEYPDYTKNLVLYIMLAIYLEICGIYSLRIRYDENYERFLGKKLEEYERKLTMQRTLCEENGITSNSLLFVDMNKTIALMENTLHYLRKKDYALALGCVQKLGGEVTPSFSEFYSRFAKALELILSDLKDNIVDNGGYLLGKAYKLTNNEAEKVIAVFYNKGKGKVNLLQRIKFLKLICEKAMFSRRDLRSAFPSSTLTNILREFKQLRIIQKQSRHYKVSKGVIDLIDAIRKVG